MLRPDPTQLGFGGHARLEIDFCRIETWAPPPARNSRSRPPRRRDRRHGCLHFIPGSHRRPIEPHRHIGDDPAVHGLHVAPGVDTSGGVPQPIPAGGATFHHQRTMHYAGPNATGSDQRACATEFQLPPADAAVYAKPKQSRGLRLRDLWDPSFIDASLDSRAVSFENPTGARGAGGSAHGGRKGRPNQRVDPGQTVVLADLAGPGTLRHIWMTFPPAPPELMRGLQMDVYYDGAAEPSISAPWLDFFGLSHGRPATYASALTAAQEGRGFNAYFPMPFAKHVLVTLTNASARPQIVYYQIDYTLEKQLAEDTGYLHVTFARQNPTAQKRDFVIASGLAGPGRFLGCNVGVRVLDPGDWYGEGEVKIFRDGDGDLPTICGTGLEDYVGTAWGLGVHSAPYGGAPVVVPIDPKRAGARRVGDTSFVSFYRWHVPDPVMFAKDLRVTIQQIGAAFFLNGEQEAKTAYERTNPVAGEGWLSSAKALFHAWGVVERSDDYCATAYVYCRKPQAVPRVDMKLALADIARQPWETASPLEALSAMMQP
jgi:hypothetical protein